jgi:predicted O-methyltransferase YrrM
MSVVAEPGFMPSVVPCLQREAEFTQLLDLYRERKPMRVLEIGTYFGGTLYHWLQNAQPGALVVSVDSYATPVDNRHLYDEWTPDDVTLHVVEGDTHAPSTLAEVREYSDSYDWIFIDAGHRYEEVKNDWEVFGSLVADGGLVCFHDILYPSVNRLWLEIRREPFVVAHEIISDPTTEWHGIGCVLM